MLRLLFVSAAVALVSCATPAPPPEPPADLRLLLARPILAPTLALEEVQEFVEARIPSVPEAKTPAEWQTLADALRARVLGQVVLRGEAARWASLPTTLEWAGDLDGGPGYRIRKLRFEAVPGMWIPALLYVPDPPAAGKVPVHLAVNGHDGKGKAADYKQLRCINLAKRGVVSLNLEWVGMGQLRGPGFGHYSMNQLDLCGTSGLAPFYLSMKRGLDVLLSLPEADPARVAVSGLSGGGWQTIFISALDPRVTLSNPVAGYSSFRTRARHFKDLGDSEQTPSDLATVADYTHLTAMRAPLPTLLTFCAKDNCCFEAGYALPPLEDAARPVFRLLGKESNLRTHVNHDPGDHNFGLDNRQALYRMFADHFLPGSDPKEIPSEKELRTPEQLNVDLPADNATFNSLAKSLAASLPRPGSPGRDRLRELARVPDWKVAAQGVDREERPDLRIVRRRLRVGGAFTVPCIELSPIDPESTAILFSEAGRASMAFAVADRLRKNQRVLAIDPFYYGESKIAQKDFLFALLVAAVGERPLGIQAGEVAAIARWAAREFGGPVEVAAAGPRSSLAALVAAAVEPGIASLSLEKPYGSLKEILDQNLGVDKAPELFCFGLLAEFDLPQLEALVAPRPLRK